MKNTSLTASYQWQEYWKERGIHAPKFQIGDLVSLSPKVPPVGKKLEITGFRLTNKGWHYDLSLGNRIKGLDFPEKELTLVEQNDQGKQS